MPEELESTWQRVCAELRRDIPELKFHIWIDPLELAGADGHALFVRAPDHVRTLVRDRYLATIRSAARRACGAETTVEIVDGDWTRGSEAAAPPPPPDTPLNPKYTFEQFVIGKSTRFAHAAALKVAELPGQAYNPLFIHGRPGLGKTHLLHAIGNYVRRHDSGLAVRYATVEQFTNEFLAALREQDVHGFKQRFRDVDVLLLDDVQFLADKQRTEEELFHTFNELQASGRQLVMTCDRAPGDLEPLADRVAERFASGLVVAIDQPDYTVRRAILAKRASLDDVEAPADVFEELARRVTSSVRALEAALIQVVAYASLRGESPTPDLAGRLLDRLGVGRHSAQPTVEDVLAATSSFFGLVPDDLLARNRRPDVARARKVAIYLARELTGTSLPEIGRRLGGRDHSTILAAVRSLPGDLERDTELARAVSDLEHRLRTPA